MLDYCLWLCPSWHNFRFSLALIICESLTLFWFVIEINIYLNPIDKGSSHFKAVFLFVLVVYSLFMGAPVICEGSCFVMKYLIHYHFLQSFCLRRDGLLLNINSVWYLGQLIFCVSSSKCNGRRNKIPQTFSYSRFLIILLFNMPNFLQFVARIMYNWKLYFCVLIKA